MSERIRQSARARNLEELDELMGLLFSEESRREGLAFEPRPRDTIIASYAKCGTTWLQQIAHGLRSHGSMDFEDVTDVTPWIEIAYDMGWDLNAPHPHEPRVFKSHLAWHEVPKNARYICSFRHPRDAFLSFYRFFEGYFFEPGAITVSSLFRWRWPRDRLAERGYWYHLGSWWEQRHSKDVLLLCYEDMKTDLPGTVRRVARFLRIDLDDELLGVVVRQSSREFMLAHKDRFNEVPFRRHAERLGALPFDSDAHKVTPGTSDDPRYHLPPELDHELDEIWQQHITARFGLDNYEALRAELQAWNGAAA